MNRQDDNKKRESTVRLNFLTTLSIQGKEVSRFLQGQLTCDVLQLENNHGHFGAHCTPQGRVIFLFYIFKESDEFYLLLPKVMAPIAIQALKKYAAFYAADITIVDKFMIYGVSGHLLLVHPHLIRIPIDSNRFIYLSSLSQEQALLEKLFSEKTEIKETDWHLLNLEACIPSIYPETSRQFLPHEINLQHLTALSFSKGCYTGQEIIARMHYRGKLKMQLYQAVIPDCTEVKHGIPVHAVVNEKAIVVGNIVDSVIQKEHSLYALFTLNKNYIKEPLFILIDHPVYLNLITERDLNP
ncbi:MAG: folate-binding protein YgfZ [Gammaproteobacteria bacterium]|nr:folate-binding protein YgfZ [Gammaproteobacteria bacterium]